MSSFARLRAPRRVPSQVAVVLALLASVFVSDHAFAQRARTPAAKPRPAPKPDPETSAPVPDRVSATTGVAAGDTAGASGVAEMTAAVPGGITAEQVGTRAVQTSYTARAQQETLEAATARVDQARTNYYPRVGLLARYTRLSSLTQPGFGSS